MSGGGYTMRLIDVIELTGGTVERLPNGIAKMTGGNIGLDTYPIFDEDYRERLNGVIIDHFWLDEIGKETITQFQFGMRRRMNEIMPYYNQMYESTRLEYDALATIDLHTIGALSNTQTNTNSANTDTSSDNSSKSRSVSSSTPQTMLAGNEDYATSASDANGETTVTSSVTESANLNMESEGGSDTRVTGYQGVASDLIVRYRDSLVNVDLMIIAELRDQFMLLLDTGEEYTRGMHWL